MIEAGANTYAGQLPTILKVNSSNSWDSSVDQAVTAGVDYALRLSAAPRSASPCIRAPPHFFELAEEIRELAAEAKAAGLAVVIWSYPRGGRPDQGGRTRARRRRLCRAHGRAYGRAHHQGEAAPAITSNRPTRNRPMRASTARPRPKRVAHVVKSCFDGRRIVVFSGGASKDADAVFQDAPRHPRRRRQRLDHRPQLLPAQPRGRAGDARPAGGDLQERGVRASMADPDPGARRRLHRRAADRGRSGAGGDARRQPGGGTAGDRRVAGAGQAPDAAGADGRRARRILEVGTLGGVFHDLARPRAAQGWPSGHAGAGGGHGRCGAGEHRRGGLRRTRGGADRPGGRQPARDDRRRRAALRPDLHRRRQAGVMPSI